MTSKTLKYMLSSPTIAFRAELADLAGGALGGLFLSQALYWQGKMGDRWWYKTDQDWWTETRLSRRNLVTIRKLLKAKGLIRTEIRGVPARTFYLVDVDKVVSELSSMCETHELGCAQRTDNSVRDERTITEEKAEEKAEDVPASPDGTKRADGLSKRSVSTIMKKWQEKETPDDLINEHSGTLATTSRVSLFYRKVIAASGHPKTHMLTKKAEAMLLALAKGLGSDWPSLLGTVVQNWDEFGSFCGLKVGESPTVELLAGRQEQITAFAAEKASVPQVVKNRPGTGKIIRARARDNGGGSN